MKQSQAVWSLIGVTILHVVLFYSVFDIYFKSPVIQTRKSYIPEYLNGEPPARRLVLFVADGLRADSLYQNGAGRTPFLKKIILQMGRWGVSHTGVPTESRPGHVSLIAGMYEDPSAITKGWKENPVDFDTVFNSSRFTFSWGSPDILPMFAKGAKKSEDGETRVFADFYNHEFEDFNAHDPSVTDTWVFEKVSKFLERAKNDVDLKLKLREDKIVFFLHLLGLDTTGHTFKPGSETFTKNLKVVDKGVQDTFRLFEKFYNDGRTSYIFTSDHGMTEWGSHGAGTPHETETPILSWGAGIKEPSPARKVSGQSNGWDLESTERIDVKQPDIAPLMASLIGVAMPQNSVGKLPDKLLKMHSTNLIGAKMANALQICEQFTAVKESFELNLIHKKFPDFGDAVIDEIRERVGRLLKVNMVEKAGDEIDNLQETCARGVAYYQRYHRTTLFLTVSAAYIGFVVLLIIRLLKLYSPYFVHEPPSQLRIVSHVLVTFTLLLAFFAFTLLQRMPRHFFLYFASPVILWSIVAYEWMTYKAVSGLVISGKIVLQNVMIPIVIFEFVIASFFDRRCMSAAIGIHALWQMKRLANSKRLLLAYSSLSLILAAFSFVPTVGKTKNPLLAMLSGIVGSVVSFVINRKDISTSLIVSIAYQLTSGFLVILSVTKYLAICHRMAWFIFITAIPTVYLSSTNSKQRLTASLSALQSMYILLSLTYEGIFSTCLIFTLAVWLLMEEVDLDNNSFEKTIRSRPYISSRDVGVAVNFVFFSVVSFFGTGNVASINSFDPKSIQTLVSIFNPFLMGSLLLLKVLIPFLMVACFVFTASRLTRMPSSALFLLVLVFSDFMALHFFFYVTDKGSWLEIGTSLSHYIISQATAVFLQILMFCAELFMCQRR